MEKKKNVLGKLKLNQFRKNELDQREMKALKGEGYGLCNCSCASIGGSTILTSGTDSRFESF